ncbi:hypothetical protein SJI00_11735 [Pseudomonas sp. RP23018S]|uniref:RHS repeat domain-containing protein n=1 Tax=Pseudomonas sp. RP23018S TaxID=3096037 RepID=UPI002ACAF030|nr:hypothetical protein [Pseudomonas sp. RP23018S]MDZ5603443.1 hypothetical protein [Pseudomonas sp. RP23018S]
MPHSINTASPHSASTLNANSIHTQAHNFLHSVQTSADPRTGQFNLAISVPLGHANDMAGPSWAFTLAYSALASEQDNGFGLGWALQYSQLTLRQNIWNLQLSSGETFAVDLDKSDLQPGGQLAFHDYKLRAMQVGIDAVQPPGADPTFRIVHKSGVQELLRRPDGRGDAYVLHELRSPEGRRLQFDWLPANNVMHLYQVRDEQRVLARYDRVQRRLILEPDSADEAAVQFLLANSQLSRLLLPEIEAPFTFTYRNQTVGNQRLCLPTHLSGPLGATDVINWSQTLEASHRLPAKAPIDFMPRVVSWLHSDGLMAPALLRRYSWVGSRNYLGGGSAQDFDWQTGRDSLYRLTIPYEYNNVETQFSGDTQVLRSFLALEAQASSDPRIDSQASLDSLIETGAVTPLTTITRTWDRHHLQLKEMTLTGDCQTLQETVYGIDYDKHWLDQSPQCQLPHLTRTTYTDLRTQASYTEETTHEYDVFGNTLTTRLPTGVVEVSEYYPACGAVPGCPYDASGMVRYLRQKTVYPPLDSPGQAPVLCSRYQYQALPSLIATDPDHAVVCLEELVDATTGEVLESTRQTYERDDLAHYGRETSAVTTLNGKATTTRFDYAVIEYPDTARVLRTETCIQGFEGSEVAESVTCSERALKTGLTRCDTSAAGARTDYYYDTLGRIVRTVVAAGSPYEAERRCRYHFADDFVTQYAPRLNDGSLAVHMAIEEADATGQRTRTWMDGSGRAILVQLEHLDHSPGLFADTLQLRYDAWGREVERITQDWDDNGKPLFTLTSSTAYDDWGNPREQTSPTGIVLHTVSDPIQRTLERWLQSPSGAVTGRQVTTLNGAGSPLLTQVFDDQGQVVRTVDYLRDGLDRVIQERTTPCDGPPRLTQFEYDHYGRVTAHSQHFKHVEQPQVRTVRRQYASHSDGDHPESISVDLRHGGER